MIIPTDEQVVTVTLKFQMTLPKTDLNYDQRDGYYVAGTPPPEIVNKVYLAVQDHLLDIVSAKNMVISGK